MDAPIGFPTLYQRSMDDFISSVGYTIQGDSEGVSDVESGYGD